MATRTTSQAGNWPGSGTALWGGAAVPTSSDDVVINHAVTIDGAAVCAGGAINAALSVSDGNSLTLYGGVTQADATFTMGHGCTLTANTTGGSFNWVMGTANTQTSCKIVVNGTTGAHSVITVTGGNYFCFDWNGSNVNNTGYELDYCDVSHVGNSDNSCAFRENTFGSHSHIMRHCTFDDCGTVMREVFGWDSGSNKSWIFEDLLFKNPRGQPWRMVGVGSSGSGTKSITRIATEGTPTLSMSGVAVSYMYFDDYCNFSALQGAMSTSVFRTTSNGQQPLFNTSVGLTDWYFLGDMGTDSNPHFAQVNTANGTYDGLVFEYAGTNSGAAQGDCLFGNMGTATVRNCIVLPDQFGWASGCLLNPVAPSGWNVDVYHNTSYGKYGQLIFAENAQGVDFNAFAHVKSNLVESPSSSSGETCWIVEDLQAPVGGTTRDDITAPAQTTANWTRNGGAFTDPITSANYTGFRCLYSSAPTGNTDGASAAFVDTARNFGKFAVYKGWASSGDTYSQKVNAGRAQIKLDTSLIAELLTWVKAGFAPTNASLHNTAHDGTDIGAVAYQSATVPVAWSPLPLRKSRNKSLVRR